MSPRPVDAVRLAQHGADPAIERQRRLEALARAVVVRARERELAHAKRQCAPPGHRRSISTSGPPGPVAPPFPIRRATGIRRTRSRLRRPTVARASSAPTATCSRCWRSPRTAGQRLRRHLRHRISGQAPSPAPRSGRSRAPSPRARADGERPRARGPARARAGVPPRRRPARPGGASPPRRCQGRAAAYRDPVRAMPSGSSPSSDSRRRAGSVMRGPLIESSSEAPRLSSRSSPAPRFSISVRSVCQRCETPARSGSASAAWAMRVIASGTPSSAASRSARCASAACLLPAIARKTRFASSRSSGSTSMASRQATPSGLLPLRSVTASDSPGTAASSASSASVSRVSASHGVSRLSSARAAGCPARCPATLPMLAWSAGIPSTVATPASMSLAVDAPSRRTK